MKDPIEVKETDLLWKKINHLENMMNDIRRATLRAKENPDRTVYAFYQSNAGQVVPNGVATVFNFEDKVYDTHSAVTVGATWKFTAPMSAVYLAADCIRWQATADWATTERLANYVYKNGVQYALLDGSWSMATNEEAFCGGSVPIYLKTGDYIDFEVNQLCGGNLTASTTAAFVWCSVVQLRFI